jgi:tetratricopeptide (TPR) repeat protein
VKTDALTELGRYDEAAAAAQRMLDLRPGLDAFARASYQRELRGDVAGARELLQRAADDASSPADKAFALYYLGELAWNNGDRTTARHSYDDALATDPAYLPALTGQAKTLAAAGDPTAALSLYREAVQEQPQPAYLIELGELLEARGQKAAAREQYDVVRATQQLFAAQGANVDLELALFEADHGSPARALHYATSAYRARPASVLTADAYAWALHRAGRDREALGFAKRANRLGTRLPQLRYHLGVIEAALGDRAAARRDLKAALALNPAFNPLQAPAARALLKALA